MSETKTESNGSLWAWSEIALLSVSLSEMMVVTAWHVLLGAPQTPWFTGVLILTGILLSNHFLARITTNLKVALPRKRVIFGTWLLVCLVASLKWLYSPHTDVSLWTVALSPIEAVLTPGKELREVWHTLIVLLVAYRGIRLARSPLTHFDATQTFQLGLLGLLLFGFVYSWIDTRPAGWMFFDLYGFFFFGLFGMITTRIARLSDLRGGRLPRLERSLAIGTVLSALIVVGLAVIAGWILGTQFGMILVAVYITLMALLSGVVLVILSPLIIGLVKILPRLEQIMAQAIPNIQLGELQELANQTIEKAQKFTLTNAVNIAQAGRITTVVIILVGILLLIYFGLRMEPIRSRLLGESDTDRVEGIEQPKQEGGARSRKQGRFRARQILAAARIRRIYAQMLDLAEKLGTPRPAAQTPLEFLPTLQALFPEDIVSVGEITHAYLKIRYGELPERAEEIQKVQAAWQRVNAHGRRKLANLAALTKRF